jgi:hypothetical protein
MAWPLICQRQSIFAFIQLVTWKTLPHKILRKALALKVFLASITKNNAQAISDSSRHVSEPNQAHQHCILIAEAIPFLFAAAMRMLCSVVSNLKP